MRNIKQRAFACFLAAVLFLAENEVAKAAETTEATQTTQATESTQTTEPPVEVNPAELIRQAGFPESYVTPLVELYNKYPQWQFQAVDTGLEWDTVIAKESRNSWNLVPKTVDDAKKSTAEGAYDWYTNTWTIYDGSSWVGAHRDYIAYCMDPRNFLDEKSIFQFESLSYSEAQTREGVQAILKGTFMENEVEDTDGTVLNYADAFLAIGQETGVSPYHLASRVRQEQGTRGTSSLISGRYAGYEGYFNYFNVGASGVTSTLVVKNGLAYAKKAKWDTRYKALLGGARLLSKNYISMGQDTLYFQKFNVVNHNALYSHQYMGNVTAAITEGQKLGQGYEEKQQPFVFRIPVYQNMPQEAVAFTASGNPNNYLKTLEIANHSLTPSFDGATTKYSLVVDAQVTEIEISATAVASTSKISGTGKVSLATGDNTIPIICKSGSGAKRTYTLTVVRQEAEVGELSSDVYKIGKKYITGITPGLKAEEFLQQMKLDKGSMKLLTADKSAPAEIVATGNCLEIYDEVGALFQTYQLVVYGDVNGDGQINVLDMIKVNRHILELSKISGCYLVAADANRAEDGVNVLDMIIINRHTLGLSTIRQD